MPPGEGWKVEEACAELKHHAYRGKDFNDASLAFYNEFSNCSSHWQMPDFHVYCLKAPIKINFEILPPYQLRAYCSCSMQAQLATLVLLGRQVSLSGRSVGQVGQWVRQVSWSVVQHVRQVSVSGSSVGRQVSRLVGQWVGRSLQGRSTVDNSTIGGSHIHTHFDSMK